MTLYPVQPCAGWIKYIPYVDDRRLVAIGESRKVALHDVRVVGIAGCAERDAFFLGKCRQTLR